ncbi:MAG: aldo/keto reductase [Chloroflexi bacterium]|nr:aldo/keto reductase [Chloroflexota bacterium]
MNPFETAQIGATDLQVTRLGLGGVALSGAPPSTNPDDATSEDEAAALVDRSLEKGVNYFDTAPLYGVGESERRVGKALQGVPRDSFVLSTKVGRVLDSDARLGWSFDFSREGVLKSFRESLERLGLESVDILYIHDPDDYYQQAISQAFPALMELREQGIIKAIGAGMNQWQMETQFAREGDFDCFLLAGRYTLLDQTGLSEFLPLCVEKNISVIAGGPYNSGILAAVELGTQATFNYQPSSQEIVQKAQSIKTVCDRYDVPLKAAALQFILAHPALVSVIPGARSIAEFEENATMIEFPIPTDLWAELKHDKLIAEEAPTP